MSIRESMSRSLKARRLAGDGRAGSWAREQAWRSQLEFIRRCGWRLAAGWALLTSPALLVWWFVPTFLQGFVLGAALVGATTVVWSLVIQSTGTGPAMMGDLAEQWTAQELRRLKGAGWRLVNHLTLSNDGDIDHVLVGPGGLLVVETKWSATSWSEPGMARRIEGAREQARRNARRFGNWAPVRRSGLPVRTVVVLWGGSSNDLQASALSFTHDDDVAVVRGRELRSWVRDQEWVIAADAAAVVETVIDEVQRHARRRDEHDLEVNPPLPTPQQWSVRLGSFVAAITLGFLAVVETVAFVGAAASIAVGLLTAVAGVVGWRADVVTAIRAPAAGLMVGAGLTTMIVMAAFVIDASRY